MSRLDLERQNKLEPKRIEKTKLELEKLGIKITLETDNRIEFVYRDEKVMFYPYSGWHTGKTIKDGRGFKKLMKQLKR